jgi:hypothetical protein
LKLVADTSEAFWPSEALGFSYRRSDFVRFASPVLPEAYAAKIRCVSQQACHLTYFLIFTGLSAAAFKSVPTLLQPTHFLSVTAVGMVPGGGVYFLAAQFPSVYAEIFCYQRLPDYGRANSGLI